MRACAGVLGCGRQQWAPCASLRRPRRPKVITLLVRHLQQPAVVDVVEYTNGVNISHRRKVRKLTVHQLLSLNREEHVEGGNGQVRRPLKVWGGVNVKRLWWQPCCKTVTCCNVGVGSPAPPGAHQRRWFVICVTLCWSVVASLKVWARESHSCEWDCFGGRPLCDTAAVVSLCHSLQLAPSINTA